MNLGSSCRAPAHQHVNAIRRTKRELLSISALVLDVCVGSRDRLERIAKVTFRRNVSRLGFHNKGSQEGTRVEFPTHIKDTQKTSCPNLRIM